MPKNPLRLIKAEDLYALNVLGDVRISPDGSQVVYSLQRVDRKSEKKFSNLWLASASGSKPQQFTWGDQSDTQPRWSPDAQQIAFLSNRKDKEKKPQLYTIPVNGGEARPLSDIPGQIGSFSWSPDGKQLLCTVCKTDSDALEREQDEDKKKLGVVARQYDRVFFKLDGAGYLPKERWHLWLVDVKSGKARQITNHKVFDEGQPAWSPDGKWITFISNHQEKPDLALYADDIFIMPGGGGEMRRLDTPRGGKSFPTFSPDGKWIAYFGSENQSAFYKNRLVYLLPADGSAPARSLTGRYDLHIDSAVINDVGSPELMPPTWSSDSQRIYFQAVKHGASQVYSVRVDGEDLQQLIPAAGDEVGAVGSFSLNAGQTRAAYAFGRIDDTAQVFLFDLPGGTPRQLTRHNRSLLDKMDLGSTEEVWFKGADGNDLQGWILKPPAFDPSMKYPSILEIHGGPMTQYGHNFMHEFYLLAAQGYVVYYCNPRGGRGYGEAHTAANWQEWGGVDFDDLMRWTDYVQALPYIDPDRMGVTGGSYGGFMTVWIIGHTRRFKAATAQRVVSNLISFWGSTDFNWIWQEYFGGKPPFEDVDRFWQHSPMKHIGSAVTPTLVIHSENDMRCPIEQGEQVFVALQRLGVDSEMLRFPDESHGLSRTGRTDRRIARLGHILRWFDTYLGK